MAEWIRIPEENGEEHFQCSKCGMMWFLATGDPIQNEMFYCPRCGEPMTGDAPDGSEVSKRQLIQFAHFVAKEVCRESFEDEAGFFAEVACRKLHKLAIVKTDEQNNWVYEWDEEDAED